MLPQHVGIIMDGNRRFSRELLKLVPWKGHEYGVKKAREVLKWACERGIKYMTTYALSLENLTSRPKKELEMILKYMGEEMDDILTNNDHPVSVFSVKVRFIGRLKLLPSDLQNKLRKVESFTKNNTKHVLNIALAYGGQQEISDAVKKITKKIMQGTIKPSDLNEDIIKKHLYTNGQPAPDLIIRTGGDRRLSNFLPFQSAYAELMFVDKKWPEFLEKDFNNCLNDFSKRQRRFGA